MADDKDDKPDQGAAPPEGVRARDLLARGELSSRAAERAEPADGDASRTLKAKDLLRAGELETEDTQSDRFGRSFMEKRYRRPVGNSERLWKKVDGEDPWDVPRPRRAEAKKKQRGVYAAGRFVRVDKHQQAKERAKKAQIPDWAKKKEDSGSAPAESRQPEVKATPTAEDPLQRLMQIIAQKNAEAQTQIDKADDAASRMARSRSSAEPPTPAPAAAPPATSTRETPQPDQVAPSPPTPRPPRAPAPRKRATRSGRLRTSSSARPTPSGPPQPQKPQKPRNYAAGRSPPKPRPAPKDLPIEMRRPPRVDPHAKGSDEPIDPSTRRPAAGRAPPKKRGPVKDLPIEMRRPPRIGPDGKRQVVPPDQVQIRDDSPAFHRPGKPTTPSKTPPVPDSPAARAAARAEDGPAAAPVDPAPGAKAEPATEAPLDRTPPLKRTPPKAKPPGGPPGGSLGSGGGMDDLFGMASQEGPMRIGRRKKKAAVSEDEEKARRARAGSDAEQGPPFPIPKVDYDPAKDPKKKE